RSNEANSISPDAFVSVHANSATVTSAAGIETFYYTNEDKPLAEELQSKLISYTGAVNRNTKYESYYVLKNTKVPSALVEVGFVSNANEAEKLKNESYQEKLINANVDAIVNYLNKNVSLSNKLISSTRISGINRYETSYKVFNQGWESSEYAVIVYGLDYPDALCATPLAAKYNAPIILAQNKRLTEQQDLVNILKEKGVKQVFIAGGTGIIPSSFEGDLKKLGISSKRLGGKDRYETSVAIAKELSSNTGEISLASGLGFADGLSISSIAGKRNMAVLLTGKDKLPKSVADYIKNSNINKTYIIGQTGVISDNVSKAVPNPERLGGANRFDTNKVVFDKFKTDINLENLYIASGLDFPDALSGSALAAKGSNFVVLSNLDVAENSIKELIKNNKAEIRSVYVLGGNSIVKDLTLNKLGIK
ncbi:MAG: N-acetylmuramoyl-L-alanine amidase, partial [Clostridiales bacterium]|nr:N-acetylmuramoyl-L-alanine amidase [Clostridiales bacterium]